MNDVYKIEMSDDGYETLYSQKYEQTFHSIHGVLQEARHVFIDGCSVQSTFDQQKQASILEIGFGTGFNFLLSASLAIAAGARLQYTALENSLLPVSLLKTLNHGQLQGIGQLREQLINGLETTRGKHPKFCFDPQIELEIIIGDATEAVLSPNIYDAVYLDAFSPDINPELWNRRFFAKIYTAIKPRAVLATYSSRGTVRRALQDVGFMVQKRPGPPGKREVLIAKKEKTDH